MAKRPDGTLERDVMAVLWQADRPLLPAEVLERLGGSLAYTSVATVLGRLHAKGLVERTESGRAFVYAAAVNESELATRRIADILATTDNRSAVIAGFVGALPNRDRRALRALLDES